ncbi:MAG TPA: Hsp20/alpha crystallin family protein [Burkholderiaceae bacterium]
MADTSNDIALSQSDRVAQQRSIAPAVDVLEDPHGITLLADMPGVARERLEVRLDGDTLAVEGAVDLDAPADMRALWAEVNVPRYRRTFRLSRELDPSRIEATLKDGVLSLRIPRQPQAQPRRIAVEAG